MRKIFIVSACLLLSACAQIKTPEPVGNSEAVIELWPSHLLQLQNLTHWTLSGRIGSRSAFRASSASIQWQQQGERFNIQLTGPLGQGALSAKGTTDSIEVHSATTGKIQSDNPQQLLNETLGWVFPLASIKSWVTGNPGKTRKDLEAFTLDKKGRLEHFKHEGWEVHYHNYRKTGNIYLPHKITFKDNDTKIIVV
ncbi:MAG: lipoprotein insertase outer membrane protein LolB, partial [Gammaproteobacteria bacterium]|nr:lipoprotein insertase outer membrane protein LolB [Gammaproteobacteria bacterium]